MVTVSQPSLLGHSYGMPHAPAYSQGVTVQAPIIGVTPTLPVPPPHPLMSAHYQMPHHPGQPLANMVLNAHNQPLGVAGLPPITMSPMTGVCQVAHPVHTVVGNGHMPNPMVPPASCMPTATLLTNGQAALQPPAPPVPPPPAEGSKGLQMLRTVGMGKYEFTDPWHPKGKSH